MGSENTVPKKKIWIRRAAKGVGLVGLSLLMLIAGARVAWEFSGSNRWELVREEKGVRVYSLKTPGSSRAQIKGVTRVRSTLSGLAEFTRDPAIGEEMGCQESRSLRKVDDLLGYGYFRVNLPFPFRTREFVVRSFLHQDSKSKEILLVYSAAPDELPPDECCLRVTEMNNSWRFTPVGNGEVEVEYILNMNEGGYVPELLSRGQKPGFVLDTLARLQPMLDREKYRQAKLTYIEEP